MRRSPFLHFVCRQAPNFLSLPIQQPHETGSAQRFYPNLAAPSWAHACCERSAQDRICTSASDAGHILWVLGHTNAVPHPQTGGKGLKGLESSEEPDEAEYLKNVAARKKAWVNGESKVSPTSDAFKLVYEDEGEMFDGERQFSDRDAYKLRVSGSQVTTPPPPCVTTRVTEIILHLAHDLTTLPFAPGIFHVDGLRRGG